jgi:crotonobetainyl-CoA:carnitine CoA-transferase CaiB-like acyl-CoA transferase
MAERQRRAGEIEAAVADWAATRDPDDATAAMQGAGVPAAQAHPATDRWYDPQLAHAEFWISQTRRYIDTHLTPAAPYRFDGERPPERAAAPVLGEHTDAVFAELGIVETA